MPAKNPIYLPSTSLPVEPTRPVYPTLFPPSPQSTPLCPPRPTMQPRFPLIQRTIILSKRVNDYIDQFILRHTNYMLSLLYFLRVADMTAIQSYNKGWKGGRGDPMKKQLHMIRLEYEIAANVKLTTLVMIPKDYANNRAMIVNIFDTQLHFGNRLTPIFYEDYDAVLRHPSEHFNKLVGMCLDAQVNANITNQ